MPPALAPHHQLLRLFARRLSAAVFLALALASPRLAVAARPSIVLILTDDQEVGLLEPMPNLRSLIIDQGATFRRAYVNEPFCGPSRATILTGKYAQNTGVTTNSHGRFYEADDAASTVAVWLKAAGYRTALIGKYLNHYPDPAPDTYVPPGWDYWAARLGDRSEEYDYALNENGTVRFYGSLEGAYATDNYAGKAVDFLRKAAADGVPFFLQLSVHAPHMPSTPARRHARLFPALEAPRTPAFDEADVGDKPDYVRGRPRFSPDDLAGIDDLYRQRARSLVAVDEAVKAVVDTLAATGRLGETYLVFASDNGWIHGQHRLPPRKRLPYEESIRIPLYVRGPGIAPGLVVDRMVGNVDFAPTFAAWAGAAVPADVDGRSFAPLLRAGAVAPERWRRAYPLVEEEAATPDLPAPDWRGVRTDDYAYVEYRTGESELYDMRADPDQLENLAGSADPMLLANFARLTSALASCKADRCRELEDTPTP
jgi:arylsulfatase A-like enzyme